MCENEDGLSLVEMIVALMIVGFALTAMASVAVTSLHAIQGSERTTRGTAMANEALEELSVLPFDDLGLYEDEAPDTEFEGEDVALLPAAAERDEQIPEPSATVERDGIEYRLETWITWVEDPLEGEGSGDPEGFEDYKRLVVEISWDVRGETVTRRVQTLRAPEPGEQPLSVIVEPARVGLHNSAGDPSYGKNSEKVDITVFARQPQSKVDVVFTDREGVERTNGLTADNADDTQWSVTIAGNGSFKFTNGETLFTILGREKGGDEDETTIGRALFLHALQVRVIQSESLEEDDPDDPVALFREMYTLEVDAGGQLCDPELEVNSHVRGALTSDVVSAILHEQGADVTDEDHEPFLLQDEPTALRTVQSTPDGARFARTVPVEADLDADTTYELTVIAERAADEAVATWTTDVVTEEVAAC